MKKPFHFSTIFKMFLSFDLENWNFSISFYKWINYLQVKVWAANGRIICRLKFNLPIQGLCADQSSICRWKKYLQIKALSVYQRMICKWLIWQVSGYCLTLEDLFQFKCFHLLNHRLAAGSYDFGFVHPFVSSSVMHFCLNLLINFFRYLAWS